MKDMLGIPRPGVRCSQQVVVVLGGDPDDLDISDLDLEGASVSTRPARIEGNVEVIAKTRSSILNESEFKEYYNEIRSEVLDTNEVLGWRIEAA